MKSSKNKSSNLTWRIWDNMQVHLIQFHGEYLKNTFEYLLWFKINNSDQWVNEVKIVRVIGIILCLITIQNMIVMKERKKWNRESWKTFWGGCPGRKNSRSDLPKNWHLIDSRTTASNLFEQGKYECIGTQPSETSDSPLFCSVLFPA